MVSLGSSYLIDLLRGRAEAVTKAAELGRTVERRFVTPPAAAEVLVGAHLLGGSYPERTRRRVDHVAVLHFDRASFHEAGRLGAELIQPGRPPSQSELFIAAIPRRHGERLLARDAGFDLVPGLAVVHYGARARFLLRRGTRCERRGLPRAGGFARDKPRLPS
jgi:predicted nucleic acid-binding protein